MSDIFPTPSDISPGDGTSNAEGGVDLDIQVGSGPTRVRGSEGNDFIAPGGRNANNSSLSTSNEDTVGGTQGNDSIATGAGDDSVQGGIGDDIINAGQGNDTISGNSGNDTLWGGQGNDQITDTSGSNFINAGLGDDAVTAGGGNDTIFGFQGNDNINSGGGNDIVFGGQDNDSISGGPGSDTIFGGQQADTISGGSGNDFISGDLGGDSITGGQGADTFAFQYYEGNEFDAVDTVTDFTSGTDKIAIDSEADPDINAGDTLPADEFATVAGASDADIDANEAKIVYDTESGIVYHNPTADSGDLNQVVNLEGEPDVDSDDFEFF